MSDREYEHVFNVWKKFERLKDYHDLYLKGDVLSLVNAFKNLIIIA